MFSQCRLIGVIIWAIALFGAVSIAKVPGDWGHSVCGPWGCGPPTQALVGCHLAWVILLAPLAISLGPMRSITSVDRLRIGEALICVGFLLLASVVVYQFVTWWPDVSDWQRKFIWQRLGFVIATNVELPMVQMILVGAILIGRTVLEELLPTHATNSPEVGEVRLQ